MARVEAITHIEAEPQRVWGVLADWEGQSRWMVDADEVVVRGPRREGVDVTIRARMRFLGVPLVDEMVVTSWEPPRLIAVRHVGRLIGGIGAWELDPTRYGTRFTWWEEFDLPLGPAGELAATVVAPLIRRQFRASLAGLKRLAETTSVRPPDRG
jgi:uncharacterized protein YndB with AHSA1/START domain